VGSALPTSDTQIGTGFVVSALDMLCYYYCYCYRLASHANKTEKDDDFDVKPIKIRIFAAPEEVDVCWFW
jgi:hypothetical protein